jgi:hypothetical protein
LSEYDNITDAGVLLQMMQENGIADNGQAERVRARFGELIAEQLGCADSCKPRKGAVELLDSLSRDGYRLGCATGGWGYTARMKLGFHTSEYVGPRGLCGRCRVGSRGE